VRVRGAGIGVSRDGACAERIVVPSEAVHPIAEDVDPVIGAAFFSPAATARVAVHDVGALVPGEVVAVTGATGAVGAMAVAMALRAGAATVLAITRREPSSGELPDAATVRVGVAALAPGERFDLLIDCVGGDQLTELLAHGRPGARAVIVGYTGGERVTLHLPNFIAHDVQLRPLSLLRWGPTVHHAADELLADVRDGRLPLRIVRRPLADLPEAFARLVDDRLQGRLVVTLVPQGEP
jgi:NADPH:quinone reductase-like Zn-dependent oxidoreductase